MSDSGKGVFLSYASQDADAAQRLCDTLRAAGVEVWFDRNELVGGDAWDAKIRKQIAECALFVPVISAATQARLEGYFRIEWRLAAQRTHAMAEEKAFLLPVVIDGTCDAEAKVPAEFKAVQWTRLRPLGYGGPGPADDGLQWFCTRVQTLLRGGAPLQPAREVSGRELKTGATLPPAPSRRRWVSVAATAALAGLVGVGAWLWLRRPSSEAAAVKRREASSATAIAPATGAITEAQKLVAQARRIYEGGDEISRENLYYADELVQKALTLDPAEPSAWEFGAWLSYFHVWHGFDDSEARRETMMRRVARARALLPDSIPVRVCEITARLSSIFVGARQRALDHSDIERELLALLERDPGNWLGRRALGICYRLMNRPDEAVREFRRAIELSGGKPMAVGDLLNLCIRVDRYDEAERVLAEALPRQVTGRLLTFDSIVRTRWRGDTAGALRAIEAWPSWFVREDRAIALAWQAAMWARDPRRALTTVVQARADYVRDVNFSGPRAVLSARAHELAGNIEAAQTDWRVVLQRCEQDFAANPQDIPALCWKSWALARMGDLPGAQAAATLVRQRADSAASAYFSVMSRAQLWATVGWTDLAIEELGREKIALDRYTMTRAYLELEPAFDPIRNDPRFKALVASAPAPATEPKVLEKSLAVLPFDNLSEDKANEILSNGISNDLIHALGRLPGLTVKGATSSFYFKDQKQKIPPREMAAQLGVSYLVQGGVQKLGNTVRVSVLLSRAATDEIVWSSEPLRRELTDVFAIQDEIVGLVAKNLSLALGTPKVAARSVNQEAYVLYLQGMEVWRNRFGPDFYERWPQIEATMRRVVEIDPGFIGAMVRLSEALANREAPHAPLDAQGRPRPVLVEALEWADRAVAADRNSGEAHLSRADTLRQMWRPAEAESAYRRAIEINPSLALARARYARLLEAEGRMDEALLEYERATVLDPLAARAFDNQALTLLHAGRFRAALAAADRSLVLAPNNYQAFFYRALALHELGRPDEAKAVALKLAQMEPDPAAKSDFAGYTCELLFREGRRDEAAKLFDRIPRRLVADRIYAAAVLGRQRDVLAELSAQWLPPYWIDEVLWNPLFDSMRADAAFVAWLQKTNLTAAHARAQAWRAASPPEKPAPLK